MITQVLELRLTDITAADYVAWCVDPEPPALGVGLARVALEGAPLGDTVRAILRWTVAPPSPEHAARAAGLPVHGSLRDVTARSWPLTRAEGALAA